MIEERIRSLSPENPVVTIENRVFDAKGEVRWMQSINHALLDDNDFIREIQAVGRDITERKQLEAKLESANKSLFEHKSFLESLINHSPILIGVVEGPEHRHIQANPAYENVVPARLQPIIGRTVREVFPEVAEEVCGLFDVIYTTGQSAGLRSLEVPIHGKRTWWDADYLPLSNESGHPTRILIIGHDITERKQVEESLRESNERFRLLVHSAGDALYLADSSGRLRDVNPEAEHQSGYSREELLGMRVVDLDVNDTPEMNGFIDPANDETTISFETLHRNKNGSVYPVEVRATPIRIMGEKLWLGLARNITDRKNAEKFRADVESIIRHDIKSPLLSLHALVGLAAHGKIDKEILQHVPGIQRSIKQVIMLVDSSDKIMKMEQGVYTPSIVRCAIKPLFESIRLSLCDLLAERNVCLDLTHTQQHLYGDEFLVEDMLQNLIKNAVEASPEGGCVKVTCWREQNWDHIDIHNLGVIPTEIREHFFDKYVTAGKRRGTGLGTYSAQLIAKAHGGRIEFTTSEEQGTTVTVSLPCLTSVG